MQPFPLIDLALPTLVILLAGFAIAFAFTRHLQVSFWTALIKAGLYLLYFGYVFNGTYTFYDDWRYLRLGEKFAENHIGLMNLITHYQYIVSTVTGDNISYYVFNATAVRLFGFGYYAPVAINVVLTFLAAGFLMKVARVGIGMSQRASIGLFAVAALSPEILAWSTIPNFKDTLVATATAAAVCAVALVDGRRIVRAILLALVAVFVLAITRLYVPLMLGVAFGVTLFLTRRGRRNPLLWLFAAVALVEVVRLMGHGSLVSGLGTLRSQMDDPVEGVIRFLVTPIPFHTSPGYGFMDIPQLIYWILLPLMFYGIVQVWRKGTMSGRFMVIYFVLMILLYGSFTTLQGARHRVQIDGLVVVFQYYGVLALLRARFKRQARASDGEPWGVAPAEFSGPVTDAGDPVDAADAGDAGPATTARSER